MTFPQTAAEFMAALPPLLRCDRCMGAVEPHEVTRAPDGAILGLIQCSRCVEDNLAARHLENQP
jgi:hypothetical protein